MNEQADLAGAMTELVECFGLKFPIYGHLHSGKVVWQLKNERFEKRELWLLNRLKCSDDVVLDIGSGLGMIAMSASRKPGVNSVVTVDANPELLPLLDETFRINGIENVTVINAVLVNNTDRSEMALYCGDNLTASSLEPKKDARRIVNVRTRSFTEVIRETGATVIFCDIEGGEIELFEGCDLTGIRQITMELHPAVYGTEGLHRLFAAISGHGFAYEPYRSMGFVVSFQRVGKYEAADVSDDAQAV